MKIGDLKFNRLIQKDPRQSEQTEGAIYNSSNPPIRRDSANDQNGRGTPRDEDKGAPNVLTGTVITSCFIQTSALPSRVEIAGNDVTFYDDTFLENGEIKGDTARLVFTHDLNSDEGFIMEKRASLLDTYDNVLSWYATPARSGRHNYMFIGRNGDLNDPQRHVNSIHFNIDQDSSLAPDPDNSLNGVFRLEYSVDGVQQATNHVILNAGNSEQVFIGLGVGGFSALMVGGDGGWAGIGYADPATDNLVYVMMYATSETTMALGADLIPDADGAYDIGSPSFKIGTLYGSVVACPLPAFENPLEILDRVPAPAYVGDRGHYGENRKYFDDLTFPEEVLFTSKKGIKDIEHNNMLGFLLGVVIELRKEIQELKEKQ